MGRYVLRRHIAVSPDRVFEGFTDPALLADWMDVETRDATGSLGSPGTRYTMAMWGPWRFRSEVVRSQPPTRYEFQGRGPLGARFSMVATLMGRDDDTDPDLLTEYALPFGPVGRLLDRLFLERRPRTIANRELDRLVELVSRLDR